MKNNKYRVSRATLYNTVELLQSCGLVTKHQFGNHSAQYEKSYKFRQHDHFICIDSGEVLEFCDPRIHEIQTSMEKMLNVKVTNRSLTFYGYRNGAETSTGEESKS
jgi:Fur family transcriptional regulator, ferric uptake regulator